MYIISSTSVCTCVYSLMYIISLVSTLFKSMQHFTYFLTKMFSILSFTFWSDFQIPFFFVSIDIMRFISQQASLAQA